MLNFGTNVARGDNCGQEDFSLPCGSQRRRRRYLLPCGLVVLCSVARGDTADRRQRVSATWVSCCPTADGVANGDAAGRCPHYHCPAADDSQSIHSSDFLDQRIIIRRFSSMWEYATTCMPRHICQVSHTRSSLSHPSHCTHSFSEITVRRSTCVIAPFRGVNPRRCEAS